MRLRDDPTNKAIANAIYNGIKRGIQVTVENESWGSALILIYSGIDTMAFLNMPNQQQDVTRTDFEHWISWYLKQSSGTSYPAADMYGARCAILHQYGAESNLSRKGKIRIVSHVDKGPDVLDAPHGEKEHVWLNFHTLAENFYKAIDGFLVDAFVDTSKRTRFEARLNQLLQNFPFPKNQPS